MSSYACTATSSNVFVSSTESPLKAVQREVSQNEILIGVSNVLEHFISQSDKVLSSQIRATSFDGPEIPDLKVLVFLEHIFLGGLCSKECFVIALIYGERLLQLHKDFVISRRNVHRLLLVSTLVASKMLDDFYCRNKYYAASGGLSMSKLNDLELKLCFLLNFDLNVSPELFQKYCDFLRLEPSFETICSTFPSHGQVHVPPLPLYTPLAVTRAVMEGEQWPTAERTGAPPFFYFSGPVDAMLMPTAPRRPTVCQEASFQWYLSRQPWVNNSEIWKPDYAVNLPISFPAQCGLSYAPLPPPTMDSFDPLGASKAWFACKLAPVALPLFPGQAPPHWSIPQPQIWA